MSFARTLVLRMAVVALLCSVTTAFVIAAGYVDSGVTRVSSRLDRVVQHAEEAGLFLSCDRQPHNWRHEDPVGIRYAHGQTFVTVPSIRLPESILRRMRRTIRRPGRPCATIVAEWMPDHRLLADGRKTAVRAMAVGLSVSMALAIVWVGWPLRRRIQRVHLRATRVGQPNFPRVTDRHRDEIGEVDETLGRAHARIHADAEALRHRSKTIQDFLLDFAHDSRTPLTALGMLLEELADEANETQTALVRAALKQVVYLRSLANNMRLWARLNEGWDPVAAAATSVDLADIVGRATGRARVVARHADITLDTDIEACPLYLRIDETLIEQAISNLLDNALVHAAAAKRIEVRLTRCHDGFRLTVADDGHGLAVDAAESGRAPSPPRPSAAHSGSGLGLAIVRRACHAAGWTCTFGVREPRGLLVTLTDLP